MGDAPIALTYDGAYIWIVNQGSGTVTRLVASDGSIDLSPHTGGRLGAGRPAEPFVARKPASPPRAE